MQRGERASEQESTTWAIESYLQLLKAKSGEDEEQERELDELLQELLKEFEGDEFLEELREEVVEEVEDTSRRTHLRQVQK